MISLNSDVISPTSQDFLSIKQDRINQEPTFEQKVTRATTLWIGKKGSNAGKQAFEEIFEKLLKMCVGLEICPYCENNEAIDIEHFFPKGLFPEKTFIWKNYLLACKKCNTTHKSDIFAVFNPSNSTIRFDIARRTVPPTMDALLINPREENPMDFLWLDIVGGTFQFTEIDTNEESRNFKKADYTIWLLKLNDRPALTSARRQAAKYYFSRLEIYRKIKKSTDFSQLENAIDDFISFDTAFSFTVEQSRILNAIKKDIQQYCHPTVWKELKRQRQYLNKTNQLFQIISEALDW